MKKLFLILSLSILLCSCSYNNSSIDAPREYVYDYPLKEYCSEAGDKIIIGIKAIDSHQPKDFITIDEMKCTKCNEKNIEVWMYLK